MTHAADFFFGGHMASLTFQDFERVTGEGEHGVAEFVTAAIATHKNSDDYKLALIADDYDHQRNTTITNYSKTLYSMDGVKVEDFTASNNRLCSNFFNRLNTQRCLYSLGNGISFIDVDESGDDKTKEMLGKNIDHVVKEAGYYALIHGVSFLYWDTEQVHVFRLTEFVPLYDESTGELRAGIRWWQLSETKPMIAVLYEEDGLTRFKSGENGLVEDKAKQAYKETYEKVPFDGTEELVDEENYGSIPIVPMYGSRLKQSTIVGLRELIDAYDLIRSGFANDLTDCAEIYWIVNNAGGMTDDDLTRFRDRLKLQHIATVDGTDGAGIVPYTQNIPYTARQAFLTEIRAGMYEDFGALDVHTIAASATNDHIDAAYQPLDENAGDFESWVRKSIVQLLALMGVDDEPIFTRDRISNKMEQVEMVLSEAQYLDEETVLRKLPNLTTKEVAAVMERRQEEDAQRLAMMQKTEETQVEV